MKPLSPREYELMVWLVNGFRLSEWAALNGLTRITACNLVMKARKKLNARTTAHAGVQFVGRYNYFLQVNALAYPNATLLAEPPTIGELRDEERTIYDLIANGLNRDEIAARTGMDERRISNLLSRSYDRLGARSLVQAVVHYKAYYGKENEKLNDKSGWIPPEARSGNSKGPGLAELEFLDRLGDIGYGLMLRDLPFALAEVLISHGLLMAVPMNGSERQLRLEITREGWNMIEIRRAMKKEKE